MTTKTPKTVTVQRPDIGTGLGPVCQVVLHNDDVHEMEYVVACLMRVFGHTEPVAVHVMLEAHARGRAVAEVEARERAEAHREQLTSMGLVATVESVGGGA